jgi:subtilisin family serine protease/subtilisin-like proprotein convertase family protein
MPRSRSQFNRSRRAWKSRFSKASRGNKGDSLDRLLRLETLEDRMLLTGSVVDTENSTRLATEISPAWFGEISARDLSLDDQHLAGEQSLTKEMGPHRPTRDSIGRDASTTEAATNQWLVQLTPVASRRAASTAGVLEVLAPTEFGIRHARGLGLEGMVLVETTEVGNDSLVRQWFSHHPDIKYFEPNSVVSIDAIPNDDRFGDLWGLHNTGQTGGTPDADIDAPEAWEIATGSHESIVAVIDTGIDYTHTDLAANIWTNPGEIAGNGLDDDGNGFVDDVHGYDFVNNDGDPMDDHFHGTHCAGTIAGVGNNADGVSGVNWSGSVMGLKFLNAAGDGYTAGAISAINYATMMRTVYGVNIQVTSNSWGGGPYSNALRDAIEASGDAGMLFVAAAGNSGSDTDIRAHYPSSYELDNIISVAATDHNDQLANFSNYGLSSVDVAAPGVNILSTVPNNDYRRLNGTSMATPHVSGVAALIWSTSPNVSVDEVKSAIVTGVDLVGSLEGKTITGGRLNAHGALTGLGLNVASSMPAARSVVDAPITEFIISFTHPYDPETVQPRDLSVNGIHAQTVTLVDNTTVEFSFSESPVVVEGPQIIELLAENISRESDGDPVGAWQAVFFYDTSLMTIDTTEPGEADTLSAAPAQIVLHFSEPIDASSADVTDLRLSEGQVISTELLDPDSLAFNVSHLTRDGIVTFTLLPGSVADASGNPGPSYVGHFVIDDPLIDRFVSADVPVSVPDLATVFSYLEITESLTVADLDVELDISHNYTSDLDVFLVAPDGTRVELFTDVGGGGSHFDNTTLDDEASENIKLAAAPFSGRFQPEGILADYDGFDAQGVWTLELHDDYRPDPGTLNSWSLVIERDIAISPRINSVNPLPVDGGMTWKEIDQLSVRFSEVMDATSVNNSNNWELVGAGIDGDFDTSDDAVFALTASPSYSGGLTADLAVSEGPLPTGDYRLTIASDGLVDLLGNPLDGNADGDGGDDYVRHFSVMPCVDTFPFLEGFEVAAIDELGEYWEFLTGSTGRIRVSSANGPLGGMSHLLLDETAAYADTQYAKLHLDLKGQSGVTLDFWQKEFGDVYDSRDDRVEISADGKIGTC